MPSQQVGALRTARGGSGGTVAYINYELLFQSFSVIISKLDCFAVY